MVDHTRGGGLGEPPKTATNHLSTQSSPYLAQRRDDPVNWYPWGGVAFAAAKAADKPIFLSIGYSSGHDCQRMARECFADEAVAAVLNEHFISIKVDRDERPDIDKVYQLTHQLVQRSAGGWPLTAFLDPATQLPFFSGTYFPKVASRAASGLPGFIDLLRRIRDIFDTKREELVTQGEQITAALAAIEQPSQPHSDPHSDQTPTPFSAAQPPGRATTDEAASYPDLATLARDRLLEQSDSNHGGFGNGPKFHFAHALHFLLERWGYSDKADREALEAVMTSLTQMARGGIYDQLGGGFCHHSTDRQWMIPQFEKTLHDNGALLRLYAHALRIGPDQLFEDVVQDTVDWLTREMQHPEGAFFAAQSAPAAHISSDSEGAYYVWRKPEVKKALTEDEYLLTETLFGLDKPANIGTRWNLHRRESFRSATERIFLDSDDPRAVLRSARTKLLDLRSQRPPPPRDEKIMAGWNGLAIEGLAACGEYLAQPHWIALAQQAMDFVREEMLVNDRLHSSWIQGRLGPPGYLDDYAFCLRASIALLQAQWREADIAFAVRLADLSIELFQADNGGCYFGAGDGEVLIHRPQPSLDDTSESGNAVLGCALFDLGRLLGEQKYLDAADAILAWATPLVAKYPTGHSAMLDLANRYHPRNQQLILRSVSDPQWLGAIRSGYTPWRRVYSIGYDGMATLPTYLPRMVSAEKRTSPTVYVCTADGCSDPIRSLDALQEALAASG